MLTIILIAVVLFIVYRIQKNCGLNNNWKNTIYGVMFISGLAGLHSCRTCQWAYDNCPGKSDTVRVDSIVEKIVKRDSLIYLPGDSSKLNLNLNYICDSVNRSNGLVLETGSGRNRVKVVIKHDTILVESHCKEDSIKVSIYDHYYREYHKTTINTVKIDPGKPGTWWGRLKAWVLARLVWIFFFISCAEAVVILWIKRKAVVRLFRGVVIP